MQASEQATVWRHGLAPPFGAMVLLIDWSHPPVKIYGIQHQHAHIDGVKRSLCTRTYTRTHSTRTACVCYQACIYESLKSYMHTSLRENQRVCNRVMIKIAKWCKCNLRWEHSIPHTYTATHTPERCSVASLYDQ